MPRLIVAVVLAVFAAISALALVGLGRMALRPFPDEHDGDDEQ